MLLFSKQWGRVAGCVLAALVFLFTLRSLNILRPYPELLHGLSGEPEKAQDLPYRPQAEEQSPTSNEPDKEGGDNGEGEVQQGDSLEAAISHGPDETKPDDAAASLATESPTATVDHIFLEGTREPEPVPGLPNASDETAASETSSSAEPTSTSFRKAIAMGRLSEEDTTWVGEYMKDWENAIYVVDLPDNETSPTGLRTDMNKAKEATPYLTYLVDNYDDFPDVAVFLHAHKDSWPAAWHNDAKGYDAVNMLNELKLDVVQDRGYVNLRCVGDPGCPAEINLNRDPPDGNHHAELAYPFVYGEFFNMTVDAVREQVPIIATPCCAQFAVSRGQVLKRSKADYERYLQLIKESKYDDDTLGTVMEYMWHILFGRDAVHCENQLNCWSTVYGRPRGWSSWG